MEMIYCNFSKKEINYEKTSVRISGTFRAPTNCNACKQMSMFLDSDNISVVKRRLCPFVLLGEGTSSTLLFCSASSSEYGPSSG